MPSFPNFAPSFPPTALVPKLHLGTHLRQKLCLPYAKPPPPATRIAPRTAIWTLPRSPVPRGGIPADGSGWTTLELDTESPLVHAIHDTIPTTYAYRARYVGKKLKYGPYGDPATCTVSV